MFLQFDFDFSEGKDVLDWTTIKERIDLLWNEFQLPIWVTEFDWNGDLSADFGDHSLHAEILENFHRLMFSHEVSFQINKLLTFRNIFKAIHGILSWRTNTLNDDNTPNKAGQAYIKLYQEEWRSSQTLIPTDNSNVEFRGFLGDYNVKIKKGNQELAEVQFRLDDDISFDCISDLFDQVFCES